MGLSLPVIKTADCPCGCAAEEDTTVKRGATLYQLGAPADRVFFVRHGTVVLTRPGAEAEDHPRAVRKGPCFVGLEALQRPSYEDTCKVVATAIVCSVPKDTFECWLGPKTSPVHEAFHQLLRESLATPPAIATRDGDAMARVARWLCTCAPDGDCRVPRRYTAGLLGMVPETLSRVLNRLAADGLIEVSRRGVRVKDLEGLRRRAGLASEVARADDALDPPDDVQPEEPSPPEPALPTGRPCAA